MLLHLFKKEKILSGWMRQEGALRNTLEQKMTRPSFFFFFNYFLPPPQMGKGGGHIGTKFSLNDGISLHLNFQPSSTQTLIESFPQFLLLFSLHFIVSFNQSRGAAKDGLAKRDFFLTFIIYIKKKKKEGDGGGK